ncbi:3-hexulose-6-phosphate synthase [Lactobacillus kullabergensis]|uniref:3-hexulose-6-phosphate synthase n=1 Tax=Lactobacillus kullabergensis TaxID=1218493 RepID=A0ABM6W1P5_9LACO|nr:3-hexulose-6-phosphate synthase [Lactobacillus kullabergensis]AWM75799.1 3-hexulose-6-phosphate synthase [Lactobacillus kullabergensis]
MKKLHVALDLETIAQAEKVLAEVGPYVDIIEIGTPLMISEGAQAVKEIKDLYPDKEVFADIKIMDGGQPMSDVAFKAGADMVSVLGASEDATIKEVIENAKKYNGKVLVDMCSVKNIAERAKTVDEWGPDYICVHVGYDIQNTGVSPIEEVKFLKGIKSKTAAAGGIKLSTFEDACKADIDDVVVGGGLAKVDNPGEVAKKMYEIIGQYR